MNVRDQIRQNLTLLLKQKKMSQKALAERLRLSQAAVTNWMKGKNAPDLETLSEICRILDTPLRDIVDPLPAEQAQDNLYFHKYQQLDEHGKALIHLIIEKELERVQAAASVNSAADPAPETEIIMLPFFDLPVSAGTGIYLTDTTQENIPVEASPLSLRANFAVRISGDSMEPNYHNGDILLVEENALVEYGDLGIFLLNGEGYFKKLGKNRLISLNPDYQPIPLHDYDSLKCAGKVIGVLK